MKIKQILKQITKPLWEKELSELNMFYDLEAKKLKEDELKNYYNNKYKKTLSFKNKRILKKDYRLDTRIYVGNYNNDWLPTFKGEDDKLVIKALKWELENIKYKYDKDYFGINEYWAFSYETLKNKKGDCFAEYEEIYTKDGLKKIKDIKEGDLVLSYDFKTKKYVYKPVIKHWYKGKLQVNRVYFRNGQHIDVSENHPFWVRRIQKSSDYEKVYLSEIDLSKWWKRKVPIAKKIPYKKSKPLFNKEIYKVIGHYVAEGWNEGSHVCSSGYELVEDIIPILEKNNIPFSEYINNSGVPCIRFLKSDLKEYLKKFKENSFSINLPEEIINLPEEYLEEFLNGLWLGDGTKNIGKNQGNREWVYSTSSKKLSEDIQRIGLHLGRTFHIWKQENHKGVGKKPIYRIIFNPKSHFLKNYGYNGISEVSISRIEKLNKVKMYDLTVKDTHTVILKNGIITHQCEDFAILLYDILRKNGIPAWRLRIAVGEAYNPFNKQTVGHAYLLYYSIKESKWVSLDGTFFPNTKSVKDRKKYKDIVYYKKVWWSFNEKWSWGKVKWQK